MRRREFITLLGGAVAAQPLTVWAQQTDQMRRIGVLMGWPESDAEAQSALAAFVQALQQLGWAIGRNARIDTRWTTSTDAESMQRFAKESLATPPGRTTPWSARDLAIPPPARDSRGRRDAVPRLAWRSKIPR
jgi:putative ABC transport system substrate-binding protein